jgi:hypothetical protein
VKKDRIYVGNGGREHNTKIKFISFSQPTTPTTTQSHRVVNGKKDEMCVLYIL